MPKMVCINCQCEFRQIKNGVPVLETFNEPPRPYKLWEADVWECPGCGARVVTGFSDSAFEHYEKDFDEKLKNAKTRGLYMDNEHPQKPEHAVVKAELLIVNLGLCDCGHPFPEIGKCNYCGARKRYLGNQEPGA